MALPDPDYDVRALLVDATGAALTGLGTDTELPAAIALGDALANPTTPLIGACTLGWDGNTWQRPTLIAGSSDARGTALTGIISNAYNYGFDGTNWARLRCDSSFNLRTVAGGYTSVVTATLTRPANTTVYAAGDELADTGGSVITLSSMARASGGSGVIQNVNIACSSNWATKPSLELWLFDTTTAPATDNTAFDPDDTEIGTLQAVIPISTSYVGDATANTGNVILSTGQINVPFKCAASANLFMRIVVRNAAQAGANSDTLKFFFGVSQD